MSVQQRVSEAIVLRCADGKELCFDSERELCLRLSTGMFLPTDHICSEKWTAGRWIQISECTALNKVLSSLGYDVGSRLRQRSFPAVTMILCLLIVAMYFSSSALSEEEAQYFVLGWAHVLLDDYWWSPWTSQFLHGSKNHMLSNVIFLCFLGVQVERALGHWRTLAVLQMGLLAASLLIIFLGTDPVIGASIWIFALWGAVFMIGWRFESNIPSSQKYGYGWWSFLIFVPIYVLQLRLDVLSHLGHLGGLLGGIFATACLHSGKRMFFIVVFGTALLPHFDFMLSMKEVNENALAMKLPQAFRETQVEGKIQWKSYPFDSAYVEMETVVKELRPEYYRTFRKDAELEIYWYQGFHEMVARCHIPSQNTGRKKHCAGWLRSAKIQETNKIKTFRNALQKSDSAKDKLNLAQELILFGKVQEADDLLSDLWLRDDAIGFEARKSRIWMRALVPQLGDFEKDRDWLIRLATSTPTKAPLREWAAIYLFEHGESEFCQLVGLICQSPEELKQMLEKRD